MEHGNLELIEQERKRLLDEDLREAEYGTEESKKALADLKELTEMANKERALAIEEEKIKTDALEKKKERRHGLILGIIDGVVKLTVAGTAIAVAVLNNRFTGDAIGEVLKYESSGEYVSSQIGRSVIGGLFRRGK